jgi:phospholipase C
MNRGIKLSLIALIGSAALLIEMSACGGGTGPSSSQPTPSIQHIVVIVQENRTPDNLFHDANLVAEGADIASQGKNSLGDVITLAPVSLAVPYDLSHEHIAFVSMYDNGAMDGADKIKVTSCNPPAPNCPPPNPQFQYVEPSDVSSYFQLAETYTFGDRMFQTNQGPSFPAHQFIISGTSAPATGSDLYAAENPQPYTDDNEVGCTAPSFISVELIDPSGSESSQTYPCFDHATLTDQLDAKQITWKYYSPVPGGIWTAPNAIKHMCEPSSGATPQCTGSDWTNHVVLQSAQVLTDVANGQLAAVTWVIPTGASSDHASINDGTGPSWVASVVNAIGNSPYWANTAIIITWDDWGGWYDHVAPSIYNSYEYGFRVPLIVVSPYAKPKYVSHVKHDFGSILKFIETTFGLSTVDPTYADARADDLSDCFDFTQTPLNFQTIKSAKQADFFIYDTRPPLPPDDD